MRIGIDVGAALGAATGLRRYTEELLRGLAEVDNRNEYFLTATYWKGFSRRLDEAALPRAPNFHRVGLRLPQKLLLPAEYHFNIAIQESLWRNLSLDVFHGTSNILPRLRRTRSVVSIHHADPRIDEPTAWRRFYFNTLSDDAARRADRVIAISDEARDRIIQRWGLPPRKIVRVYCGGPPPEFNSEPRAFDPKRLGIPGRYLLFVSGDLTERKNIGTLLVALSLLVREANSGDLRVVLVARRTALETALRAHADRLGVGDRVVFLEGLSLDDLCGLYQNAAAMVYPSLIEGFGLPLIESMACGTPVIAARASCLPEIVADAGLLFEPLDADGLAQAVRSVLRDAALREELRRRGLKRASFFDRRKTARETLEVYKAAAA